MGFGDRREGDDYEMSKFVEGAVYGIIAGVLFVLVLWVIDGLAAEDFTDLEIIEHRVVRGETLWEITEKYKPKNIGYGEYIYEIRKLNEMECVTLMPGQVVKVYNGREGR